MKKLFTPLFFIFSSTVLLSQTAVIRGKISDQKSKETIVGASVVVDDTTGTVTDINGNYIFSLPIGEHKVYFKNVSYKTQTITRQFNANDTVTIDIQLENAATELGVVVVSAGKFEQNLSEVTVSMEVLKPTLIENKSIQTIESAMDQVPGVNVIDGQANIRGGSGFSYGAGSRVLMLLDEVPMLSADAGDVKWTFLPIENCEQIEVIKGASSALFGSSAMNGVINFRTAYAKDEPETKINFYGGRYDDPRRKELIWWQDGNPTYGGINFTHLQKVKNLDVVIGANLYNDEGYRYLETEQRYRVNTNLRYNFKGKLSGLQVGVNANTIRTTGGLFLLWMNADSGAYRPAGNDLSHYITYRTYVDPFANYFGKHGGKHSFHGRFYRIRNTNNTNQESVGDVYYGEYQFQKRFDNKLVITTGAVDNYDVVKSGPLYGNHYSTNISAYLQADKKWDRLSVSLGVRAEYFKMDSVETQEKIYWLMDKSKPIATNSKVKPVFRAGVNYRLAKATFARLSFGQGFRFPAVAEKFVRTSASALDIYPNDSLRPERGWSAEIGIKQGLKLGEWNGFLDLAGFWTEYQDMMEFTFGQWGKPTDPNYGLGFKSRNIGNTRITGVEVTLMGTGKIGPIDVNMLMGYTYIDPIKTDFDRVTDSARGTTDKNILKYRFQHTAKADLELGYKKVKLGVSCRYTSHMDNVDRFFVDTYFFPGNAEYMKRNPNGDWVWDGRISYQLIKQLKLSFIVNNIFNHEYISRPMDVQAPRVYALQLSVKL